MLQTQAGKAWPADPCDSTTVSTNLYSGTSGVVLFFLEMYRATQNKIYLNEARAGADYLIATLPDTFSQEQSGLYTGVAGIGFVLEETFKMTGDKKYRDGALRCVKLLHRNAKKTGAGIEWNSVTDIIGGSAGSGLFLLYAAREMNDPASRDLAIQAGLRLIELGKPENGGLKWAMSPDFPRLMPNFSHGTAGICYFLTSLYAETKRKEFLEAALAGANYLKTIANTAGDACMIFHHEPDGKDLYYLGWCHGPVGTARLFYRLWQVTQDSSWMVWVKEFARAILQSGIPEKQTPGFWNNVSQCCGSAGVAEFFLSLYRVTSESEYLEFAKRVTADLLKRATREGEGIKWIQAEHRVKPDLLIAQTGYMQGAAGIGMLLLHLDALEQGRAGEIVFPDSPFY
ncbi:MAG: lanthionine synthetase LanC family protein [bacterium]